jgi:hypothetical protein
MKFEKKTSSMKTESSSQIWTNFLRNFSWYIIRCFFITNELEYSSSSLDKLLINKRGQRLEYNPWVTWI